MIKRLAVFMALILLSLSLGAQEISKDRRLNEFKSLLSKIEAGYALLDYKEATGKINWDQLKTTYTQMVEDVKSNREYYYLIHQFIAEFQDGHMTASLPTSHKAVVPFFTDYIGGKVVVWQSRVLGVQVGDEILEVDGKPVQEAVAEIAKYISGGSKLSQYREATWSLTYRDGKGLPIPETPTITMTFQTSSGSKYTQEFQWFYSGTPNDEFPNRDMLRKLPKKEEVPENINFARLPWTVDMGQKLTASSLPKEFETLWSFKDSSEDHFQTVTGIDPAQTEQLHGRLLNRSSKAVFASHSREKLEGMFVAQQSQGQTMKMCNPETDIRIPQNAQVLPAPFRVYMWEEKGKKLGYLRLPHYIFGEVHLSQYAYIIGMLDKRTDGLIIDQSYNCGGMIDQVFFFASLFLTAPTPAPKFRLLANKENKIAYENLVQKLQPATYLRERVVDLSNLITKAWDSGHRLTEPNFYIEETIYPAAEDRYTKPVIILVNELSASGGDMFPAILQGTGRVKVLGARTAGLGGSIEPAGTLDFSRISISLTKDMFFRPDGVPIENNGTEPDIPYTSDANDALTGLAKYRNSYTEELLKMVNPGTLGK